MTFQPQTATPKPSNFAKPRPAPINTSNLVMSPYTGRMMLATKSPRVNAKAQEAKIKANAVKIPPATLKSSQTSLPGSIGRVMKPNKDMSATENEKIEGEIKTISESIEDVKGVSTGKRVREQSKRVTKKSRKEKGTTGMA